MRPTENSRNSSAWHLLPATAVLLGATAWAQADVSADTAAAIAVVSRLHSALIETAAAGDTLTRENRYQRLLPVVSATHDLAYIAQLTIRRAWRELEPAQRDTFVSAFERLSAMTYATRFASVGAESFEVLGAEVAGAERIEVHARILRSDDDDIPLDYLLQRDGDGWRIINVLADRVSDLALKRAEYQRVLNDGSIDELIDHIEAETARL